MKSPRMGMSEARVSKRVLGYSRREAKAGELLKPDGLGHIAF